MPDVPEKSVRHSHFDDAHALFIGVLFCALGIYLLKDIGLVTGGVAGVALLLSYVSPLPPGGLFVVLNLPFLYFAWRGLGLPFTIKTLIATVAVGVGVRWLPGWLPLGAVNPLFVAILAGVLIGMGILALARHRSSVGGVGILALYLQERRGWRAGYVQMGFDGVILAASLVLFDVRTIALSIVTALATNLVLALNHKPGRYSGY